MKDTCRPKKTVSVEQIARIAEGGNDVLRFLSNTGKMMRPMQRVNVDFESPNVEESSKRS